MRKPLSWVRIPDVEKVEVEEMVERVLSSLPPLIRSRMENVEFVIEEKPSLHDGYSSFLLGLYQGVPLPRRGRGYSFVMPDRIVLFVGNILRVAPTREAFYEKLKEVILHEIGHYFGFSEEDLQNLGEGV